jgi:radical SAM protein with 4Fe4S-binding SPASM domain
VIAQIAGFGQPPVVVLSGGDPFMRRDLFDIIGHARAQGLTVAVAPSATALVTRERLKRLVSLGVSSISLSLDGAKPGTHDSFRGFTGTFQRTVDIMGMARSAGLPFQVNTTVTRTTRPELPAMPELLGQAGASTWDLFFLVPTGRARPEEMLSASEHEELFAWLLDNARSWPFRVKTTLAQHFRRAYVMRRLQAGPLDPVPDSARAAITDAWPGPATNEGRGVFFISHVGDIYPSGFLPLRAGNVRTDPLVQVYRDSALFRQLRDPGALKDKCGVCAFNTVCGGSRARAYAVTGDYLASEPCCVYAPEVSRAVHPVAAPVRT